MPAFRSLADHQVYEKRPGEVVTDIDLIAERLLSSRLTDHVYNSRVLGEESFEDDPSLMDLTTFGGAVWIIDPIDGTQNYAKGNTHFAIMVTFRRDRTTQAAWIYDPVRDKMFTAQVGQGAEVNGEKLAVKGVGYAPSDLHGSLGHRLSKRHRLLEDSGDFPLPTLSKRLHCCGQEYMALALGDIQFLQYGVRLKPWDHSAGVLIATEAGYYAAFIEDESRYDAALGMPEGYLMIAPDRQIWRDIRALLWVT